MSQLNANAGTTRITSAVAEPRMIRNPAAKPRVADSLMIVTKTGPTDSAAPNPSNTPSHSTAPIMPPLTLRSLP